MGSQDERTREAGLLRALGATRRQLSQAQWIEFALVGGLAGLLAATGAAAVGWALAKYVVQFRLDIQPTVWLAGLVVGAVLRVCRRLDRPAQCIESTASADTARSLTGCAHCACTDDYFTASCINVFSNWPRKKCRWAGAPHRKFPPLISE